MLDRTHPIGLTGPLNFQHKPSHKLSHVLYGLGVPVFVHVVNARS